jgi:hypothetical protein
MSSLSYGQVFMDADSTGDAYSRIDSKGFGYEVPDCVHPIRHIEEGWNTSLKKFAFIFSAHVTPDNDRCINFDRQRTEIKTWGSSPDSMKAFHGDIVTYRWKFKLDSLFQSSPNFTHLHQIKAGDGPDADLPLITFTGRYGSSHDNLQIIFTAPLTGNTTTLAQTDLTPFKGTWVEAYERILFTEAGTYSVIIKKVDDETVLLNYSKSNLAMWREGSTFMRPKWGIYRSLLSSDYLRDENVLFADFSLKKGATINLPNDPGNLNASVVRNIIDLTWSDNSNNEDQFRIDRSADSLVWNFLGNSKAGATKYSDTLNTPGIYYYRVRSENTSGNSAFSNIVKVNTNPSSIKDTEPKFFALQQSYPNPFNPSTTIRFTAAQTGHVKLWVNDILGRDVAVIVDEIKTPGNYSVTFDASRYKLSSGIYLYTVRINSADGKQCFITTRKMILMK